MIFLVSYYIASSQISPDFVRVVSDTLGYDSLRQVLYPSGQLFFKYLIKMGKLMVGMNNIMKMVPLLTNSLGLTIPLLMAIMFTIAKMEQFRKKATSKMVIK